MLAHGWSSWSAPGSPPPIVGGGKTIEVATLRITEAGQRVLHATKP